MTLRIVHVVRQYAPSVGGLEAVVSRLAAEQRRRFGHDVRVVTLDRLFVSPETVLPHREIIDGVAVTRLSWRGSSRYPWCPQVVRHLGDADVVHVHAIDFFFDWLSLTRLMHRKPMIASTHGGFFHTGFASTLKRVWFRTITRASASGYQRLVATSENDGTVFRNIARRVTVVENGADVDRYRDAASPEHVPTLLSFGRWSSNKGLLELIDLVAALQRADARWRLMIAGRPHDLGRQELEARIESHDLQAAVSLHEAPSDEALGLLMRRASYFACLSRHEGFGIAAVEAMSAGLVPVLSDIPPFRKLIEQSGCGLLLPLSGDVDSQAAAVMRLHTALISRADDARARTMDFTRRYAWPAVVDRYEVVYRETLAPTGRVAPSIT